jgi:hypothetical protein
MRTAVDYRKQIDELDSQLYPETKLAMSHLLEKLPKEPSERTVTKFVCNCEKVQKTMNGGTLRSRQILALIFLLTGAIDFNEIEIKNSFLGI